MLDNIKMKSKILKISLLLTLNDKMFCLKIFFVVLTFFHICKNWPILFGLVENRLKIMVVGDRGGMG